MIKSLISRYPKTAATIGFIAVMTLVKLGARDIVTNYGTLGTIVTIAVIFGIAVLMERR